MTIILNFGTGLQINYEICLSQSCWFVSASVITSQHNEYELPISIV